MTALEKLKIEHPECVDDKFRGGAEHCPGYFGYLPNPESCAGHSCDECWNREIPEKRLQGQRANLPLIESDGVPQEIVSEVVNSLDVPTIKDSGTRREFETGAVRDIQEGKGRCDLLPLDVLAALYEPCGYNDQNMDVVFEDISKFISSGEAKHLFNVLEATEIFNDRETMFLEVAKHFEEGAKKYGEYNWQKGIPTHCYIDSAVRHYLKYLRGDKDEPHDRAFVWNILCCIWTCKHKPELNDYAKQTNKTSKKDVVSRYHVINTERKRRLVKTDNGPKECVVSDVPIEEVTHVLTHDDVVKAGKMLREGFEAGIKGLQESCEEEATDDGTDLR